MQIDKLRQFSGDTLAVDGNINDNGKTLPGKVVNYIEQPYPPTTGKLIAHKVHAPYLPWT